MGAELMQWLIEATVMTTAAVVLALALRLVLSKAFGIRAAILIWALVPLALIAGALPARSVDAGLSSEVQTVISLDGLGAVAAAARDIGQSFPVSWHTAVFAAWLAGVALMLVVLAHRQNRFRSLLGVLRPAGPRLFASDRVIAGPSLLGVIRPRVIVPRDFERRFDTRQRRLMLAHEYTHLRRGDPVWNLIAAGVRCLFWFNPLVHIAAIRFRHDQELACDATVLAHRRGARRTYAAALLAQENNLPTPAIGFGTHPLKERIHMLAKLKTYSRQRHLAGSLVAITLALVMVAIAWAANPESESGNAAVDEPFAFDIEVTVDGRSQAGRLILSGDTAVASVGGQPRILADRTLYLKHRDDDSGWAAEVTIDRMAGDKFSVTSAISRNEDVVAEPRMIIGSDAPASIETSDPETGEIAYRMVLTPVDPVQVESAEAVGSESATLFLTVNDTDMVSRPVEWPRAPGDSMSVGMSYDGEPEPWNARVGLQRLAGDRIEVCIESIYLQGNPRSPSDGGGCMSFDADISANAFMLGGIEEAGISFRLNMVPNTNEEVKS